MPSNYLILCHPLLLLPSISPSIRVFSNESALHIRWPKYWSFSSNSSLSNEHPGRISFRMDWLDSLQSKGLSRVFSNTTVQKHQFFSVRLSLWSNSHIHPYWGFPDSSVGKRIHLQCRRPGFDPWVGKIPWRRERLPTPVFWSGKFHGLCSPWGRRVSDMTE